MLITETFDNLHRIAARSLLESHSDPGVDDTEDASGAYGIYEVHGNANFMRCSEESLDQCQIIMRTPPLSEFEAAKATNASNPNFCLVPMCS